MTTYSMNRPVSAVLSLSLALSDALVSSSLLVPVLLHWRSANTLLHCNGWRLVLASVQFSVKELKKIRCKCGTVLCVFVSPIVVLYIRVFVFLQLLVLKLWITAVLIFLSVWWFASLVDALNPCRVLHFHLCSRYLTWFSVCFTFTNLHSLYGSLTSFQIQIRSNPLKLCALA